MTSASPTPPSVVCALVLIEDRASLRDAEVPEEIVLQPLDVDVDANASDGSMVPGIASSPRIEDALVVGRQKDQVNHAMDCTNIPLLLSRKHAALTCDGRAHYVRDLSTTNGTFINGKRIPTKEDVRLEDGDVVAFGGPRYVARDAGRLTNPFRFRYVKVNGVHPSDVGVDGASKSKRPRLSQDDDGVELSAMELSQMSQGMLPSQTYHAIQASQNSEMDDELDYTLKDRLRTIFEDGEFAQACAKRYFGMDSPCSSPRTGSSARSREKEDGVNKTAGWKQRAASKGKNINLKEKLSQAVVDRLVKQADADLDAEVLSLERLKSELQCTICTEYMVLPHSLIGCGHVFCLDCIDNTFCHNRSCPLCRQRPLAPRELLFSPAHLTAKLIDEHIIPTLGTKELLVRKTREKGAIEAREKRVHLDAELAKQRRAQLPNLAPPTIDT